MGAWEQQKVGVVEYILPKKERPWWRNPWTYLYTVCPVVAWFALDALSSGAASVAAGRFVSGAVSEANKPASVQWVITNQNVKGAVWEATVGQAEGFGAHVNRVLSGAREGTQTMGDAVRSLPGR